MSLFALLVPRRSVLLGASFMIAGQSSQPGPIIDYAKLFNIYFDPNSAALTAKSITVLSGALKNIQVTKASKVTITGHTDDAETSSGDLHLSEQRAAAVKAYLVGAGVAEEILVATGVGASRPLALGSAHEASNRRVDLRID